MDQLIDARLEAGKPWPLGAHWDGEGINFAVFSAHAQAIDLCLFDELGARELTHLRLPSHTNEVWHGYLRGAKPGLVYGLRAHGPWRPDRGHRFNPYKLLLDPYAREIIGRYHWRSEHFSSDRLYPHHMDMRDNAAFAQKAVVVDDRYDWGDDKPPAIPFAETVLYEMHVKGFTKQMPGVPEALRGSYAGLASDAAIAHLKRIGITSVSLLPVHERIDEQRLIAMGLTNYWGYNTIGFFSVEPRLASRVDGQSSRDEFRAMVKRLHAEGIEVILDVVYNHTMEGDENGPTVSFRGLDNVSYYRMLPGEREFYENITGCGNALDIRSPRVLQMVMDSLRYWVREMHVDGFRFDLAPVLGRGDNGFERNGPFFTAVAQDPTLAGVKMIAEPWDIGLGGYQVGNFARGWFEWNDKFRDGVRAFWLGHPSSRGELAQRLTASSDVYQPRNRPPSESVNFITAHDGFTLRDLLSYHHKRNEANGENNRDGHGHNLGWNCGVEGETDDKYVNMLRGKLQRAMLTTLLLSQGTPMLTAGDELGHSQNGNNNAYCQDNAISWIDWSKADQSLIDFTARVIAVRKALLPFANRWYTGLADRRGVHDLSWSRTDGAALTQAEWRDPAARAIAAVIGAPGHAQQTLLLLTNGEAHDIAFYLPKGEWQTVIDSSTAAEVKPGFRQDSYLVVARSIVLLSQATPP